MKRTKDELFNEVYSLMIKTFHEGFEEGYTEEELVSAAEEIISFAPFFAGVSNRLKNSKQLTLNI